MNRKILILSSLLLGIAQPGLYLGLLVFVAFVPLFYYLTFEKRSNLRLFSDGVLYGLIFSCVALYWVGFSSMAGFVGMAFTIGFRYGVLFLVVNFFLKRNYPVWIFIPFFIIHEYAYLFTDIDFPWHMIAYTLTDIPLLIQIAEITGMPGIALFILLINYFIFKNSYNHSKISILSIIKDRKVIIAFLIYFGINVGLYSHADLKEKTYFRAGIVQPNIDPFYKWRTSYRDESLKRLNEYTNQLRNENVDIIVWPETALPYLYEKQPILTKYYNQFVEDSKISLIIGSLHEKSENGKIQDYNSAYLLSNKDSLRYVYDKMYLVPVIEKEIFNNVLSFINNLPGLAGFNKGEDYVVFESNFKLYDDNMLLNMDSVNNTLKSAVTICIESNYPNLYRHYMNDDVDFFMVITNDGWFFPNWKWFRTFARDNDFSPYIASKGAFQHHRIARIRAIESRRPIIRAANTGVSSIISFTGSYVNTLDQYVEGKLAEYVPMLKHDYKTLYVRFGDYVVWISMIFVIVVLIDSLSKKHYFKSLDAS